jgi:hypothetical protein
MAGAPDRHWSRAAPRSSVAAHERHRHDEQHIAAAGSRAGAHTRRGGAARHGAAPAPARGAGRDRGAHVLASLWTGTIAPIASAVLLAATLLLIIDNFGLLTGTDSTVIHLLPLVLVVAFVLGLVVAGRRRDAPVVLDEVPEEPALVTSG